MLKKEPVICQYCNKQSANKYILATHQKQTKSCLEIQKAQAVQVVEILYKCEFCNKKIAPSTTLRHQSTCKAKTKIESVNLADKVKDIQTKLDEQIAETLKYKTIVKELEKKNNELTKKVTTTTKISDHPDNTTIQIIDDKYPQDDVTPVIDYVKQPLKLTEEYMLEARESDGYVNITTLCKAGGRKFATWNRSLRAKRFLSVLSNTVQICTQDLVFCSEGFDADGEREATWVHPYVAINIAQWISPHFELKVSMWIYQFLTTGKLIRGQTKTHEELMQKNKKLQLRIEFLEKKYMKCQPRQKITETNVIYILTTSALKAENRYIFGKTVNLTNRLSTYNKTDEHEIVYYQSCIDKEDNV